MSTSFVRPATRPVPFPAKTRPISAMPARTAVRTAGAGLTVVRPARVGGPTIGHESPAPASLPHLVDDAVTAALSGLDVLEQNVPVVALNLRQGRTWEGNLGLASVMQITRTLVTLAATISHRLASALSFLFTELAIVVRVKLFQQPLSPFWIGSALKRPLIARLGVAGCRQRDNGQRRGRKRQ